ncbi:MAG: DNA polymerase III subunit alpha [Stutzerimonas stutzeri]|nr:MAG: DNA polymerase III subunit alpha [Stutzerimonas stutzeri]
MLLTCESHFSRQRRSTLDPKKLVKIAKAAGYTAVGIADRMSLAGAYEFSQAAQKEGVTPLIGERLPFGTSLTSAYITVHAMNERGWFNLIGLNNRCHIRNGSAPLTNEDLIAFGEGIFVTSGGLDGPLDTALRENRADIAEAIASDLAFALGSRFAIAIERHESMDEADVQREQVLVAIANRHGISCVGISPARHIGDTDRLALEVLTYNALGGGSVLVGDPAFPAPAYGSDFKDKERMEALFADAPQLLRNAETVAGHISWAVPSAKPHLPRAKNVADEDATIISSARAGLHRHLSKMPADAETSTYVDRLEFELGHITKLKFSGYFLIVADFIQWCRDNGIPVGPGRGSGAGSLVAWCLGITDIDPIRWGLLFERFINPERVSLPDFDIDFCEQRRGEVLEYVRNHYGHDYVAQIAAYTTMQPKGAFKAAARAVGIPNAIADSFTKKMPDGAETFDDIKNAPEIQDAVVNDVELRQALEIAETLVGVLDSQSEHAAGVVISDHSLFETTPLMGQGSRITQYSMKPVESTGLVKFDFLGLKTLSVIQRAWEIIREHYGSDTTIRPDHMPFDDSGVFDMINRGRTLRLFQIERAGMTKALLEINPTGFEDLIAIVSLYRPGPMDQIPLYADRKAGRAPVEYPHPKLASVLRETYGIFVYQEQIIEAAQILAGYTLGEADVLRRAIGKKIAAELKAGREGFVAGCEKHSGIPRADGEKLFDTIEKFADYGFNKSHAAAYALICWQTACLKHHYPLAFACANLDWDSRDGTDKVEEMIRECERMGITFLPPDINRSGSGFTIEGGAVRYGLKALAGISESVGHLIDRARSSGPFVSASDAVIRLSDAGLNRNQIIALVEAGAFDGLLDKSTDERRPHLVSVIRTMSLGRKTAGPSLFDNLASETEIDAARRARRAAKTREQPDLAAEIEAENRVIGYRLNRHPTAQYQLLAYLIGATPVASLRTAKADASILVIGRVEGIYEVGERRPDGIGADGVEIIIADESGRTRIHAQSPSNLPKEGEISVMTLATTRTSKVLQSWKTPAAADQEAPAALVVAFENGLSPEAIRDLIDRPDDGIKAAIRGAGRGGAHKLVLMVSLGDGRAAEIWTLINRVQPTNELQTWLKRLPGIQDVWVR